MRRGRDLKWTIHLKQGEMELMAMVDTISPQTAASSFGPPVSSSHRVRWGSGKGGDEGGGGEGGVDVIVGGG